MNYGDGIVIVVLRNLLLIMSNIDHLTENSCFTYLYNGKYRIWRSSEGIFIINGISSLQTFARKLFVAVVLGKRLLGHAENFSNGRLEFSSI